MKTPRILYTLPLASATILAAPVVHAIQTYCTDPVAEEGWQLLLKKHPGDRDVSDLYNLRRSLCRQIKFGSLNVDAATNRFEEAKQRLIKKWLKQNKQRQDGTVSVG